jgi:glycosyltransferase involved in cell wall biosynthesis
MPPLTVSILIPCYNADRWIAEAIDSALNQTYPNKEVIVVDDGSSDRSLEIIKSYSDRIRWETQPNQGGNVTRNRLLELSSGEWLQYLDGDDYLLPDKVNKQMQFLAHVPHTDVVYSPSILEFWESDYSCQEALSIAEPHDPWLLLARWYLPQTGSPLWRKQAIVDVGCWKPNQSCCQEHELYLRLLMAGKQFRYFGESGSVYRQWSESTVCKRDKSATRQRRLEITDRLEQHLDLIGELTKVRQDAINQSRFDCARLIWLSDMKWASRLIAQVRKSDRTFLPQGESAPQTYRLMYKLFGFAVAETVASQKRGLSNLTWRISNAQRL